MIIPKHFNLNSILSALLIALVSSFFVSTNNNIKDVREEVREIRKETRQGLDDIRKETRKGLDDIKKELVKLRISDAKQTSDIAYLDKRLQKIESKK